MRPCLSATKNYNRQYRFNALGAEICVIRWGSGDSMQGGDFFDNNRLISILLSD